MFLLKVTKELAQHFVYGTYYIIPSIKIRTVNKNNHLKIIVKSGKRPCELDTKNIHVTLQNNEIILNHFSKDSCDLLMEFAENLHQKYEKIFTFQYSGIHLNSIQNLRKQSPFKVKRSGESIDENDIITPYPDKFYAALLGKEIIEYNGTKEGKVAFNFGEENIILKIHKRNKVLVLLPGTK